MRAKGMPLGLLPGMRYEEKETMLAPGESVLLHSDGLAEAHNEERDMFGFPRLMELVGARPGGPELIDALLVELERFTGAAWEQGDDITLVTVARSARPAAPGTNGRVLAEFTVPAEEGTEGLPIE